MSAETRWNRRTPFLRLSPPDIEALIGQRIDSAEPLSGGLRNTNYRVRLADSAGDLVLRVYSMDPSAAHREPAILHLVRHSVPTPIIVRADPEATPPWALLTFVDGERFDLFIQHASDAEVGAVAYTAGEALAAIHAFQFEAPGFFDADLNTGPPPWPDVSWAEMLEPWLRDGRAAVHLGPDLTRRVRALVDAYASHVGQLEDDGRLVHADFKPWNLLARHGRIAAVLDWEFSYAGQPMVDIGIFLRYSASLPTTYVSGFVDGYGAAGGDLPDDWYRLARLIDLVNLVYFLERPEHDRSSPDDPVLLRDVVPLIETTVTEFAP